MEKSNVSLYDRIIQTRNTQIFKHDTIVMNMYSVETFSFAKNSDEFYKRIYVKKTDKDIEYKSYYIFDLDDQKAYMVKVRKFASWNVNEVTIENRSFIMHFLKSNFNNVDILRNYTDLKIDYFPLDEVRKLCLEDNIRYAFCEVCFDRKWKYGNIFMKNSNFAKKYKIFKPFYFNVRILNLIFIMYIYAVSENNLYEYSISVSDDNIPLLKRTEIIDLDKAMHFKGWSSIWKYIKEYPCIEQFRIMEELET